MMVKRKMVLAVAHSCREGRQEVGRGYGVVCKIVKQW
jgi:hypothetical protein